MGEHHVYDTRALTDDQQSLADDIASAMGWGHEETCAVWHEDPDGCSCPLIQSVADGLAGANVVEVIQEQGYDRTTQRGDRLIGRSFRPHPLAPGAEADAFVRAALERLVRFCDYEMPYWEAIPGQGERWAIYVGLLKDARAAIKEETG